MLTRVVIYRRHLRHSTLMPSSLRLCAQLSSSQYSNLPPCKPSRLFSSPLYIIISSLLYLRISLSSRPDAVAVSAHYYKKHGWGVGRARSSTFQRYSTLPPIFRTLFQVPYPATPLFASLAKTAGYTPIIPIPRLTTRYSQFHPLGVSCG